MSKTWYDLVGMYFPDAGEEEAEFILREKTGFPLASVATVADQLRQRAEAASIAQEIGIAVDKELLKRNLSERCAGNGYEE